jgi:hypothetical protein
MNPKQRADTLNEDPFNAYLDTEQKALSQPEEQPAMKNRRRPSRENVVIHNRSSKACL